MSGDATPPTNLRRERSYGSASASAPPPTELRRSRTQDSAPGANSRGSRQSWGFMGRVFGGSSRSLAAPATSSVGADDSSLSGMMGRMRSGSFSPPSASPSSSVGIGGRLHPSAHRRGEDTERDFLETEIQKRDRTVTELEHTTRDLQRDIDRAKAKLDGLRRRELEETYLRKVEVARRKQEYRSLQARAKVYKRDMDDRDSLLGYAELIREAAPKSIDSSYVMRLQSQLSKATKKMEAMHGQMDLVRETCDEVMDSLRVEIGEVIEEKCRIEVEMVDQLKVLRAEKDGAEEGYSQQLEMVENRLTELREREERMNNPDGPEGGGGGDDGKSDTGENEAKEEVVVKKTKAEEAKALREAVDRAVQDREESESGLRRILRDRREQIARLQQESELFGESMKRITLQ